MLYYSYVQTRYVERLYQVILIWKRNTVDYLEDIPILLTAPCLNALPSLFPKFQIPVVR
jgi:hypothetical protein